MKSFKVLSSVLFLVSTVTAQYNFPQQRESNGYNYQPAPPPRDTYLPPTNAPVPTTRRPYESQSTIGADGLPKDDEEHMPGLPYDFTYSVKDDYGNDFAHTADSDGEFVKGEYRTLLPDGRMQIVKYTADWKNGFNADVIYEGDPVAPPPTSRPTRPPFVQRTTTERYEYQEDNDSQSLTPSRAPPTTIPPFRCYPGSTDPRCPPDCYPGSKDYRCPKPTTTTKAPFRCYPGSTDPRCPPDCYPGSKDYRCPKPTTTTTTTTTKAPFRCYPGSTDSRCPPDCYPGSKDYRCPKPTTTTTNRPVCYPGSTDPRCPKPTTTKRPFQCYPGVTDPRCPPNCYPGATDFRCRKPTTTEPPTEPPGLYGAPSLPFGVRNSPKFGYSRK